MKFWCKVDGHAWFDDTLTFSTCTRCRRCGEAQDDDEASRVDFERGIWEECSKAGLSYRESVVEVVKALAARESEPPAE